MFDPSTLTYEQILDGVTDWAVRTVTAEGDVVTPEMRAAARDNFETVGRIASLDELHAEGVTSIVAENVDHDEERFYAKVFDVLDTTREAASSMGILHEAAI
jgi:hypothetical protein